MVNTYLTTIHTSLVTFANFHGINTPALEDFEY